MRSILAATPVLVPPPANGDEPQRWIGPGGKPATIAAREPPPTATDTGASQTDRLIGSARHGAATREPLVRTGLLVSAVASEGPAERQPAASNGSVSGRRPRVALWPPDLKRKVDMLRAASRIALAPCLIFGALLASSQAADLSRYREFQLGASLATITQQTGLAPARVKVVHTRPALIQELEWRPQAVNAAAGPEAVLNIVFRFFNGELCQVAASYDRYEIEGLTAGDMIESISSTFGMPGQAPASAKLEPGRRAEEDEVLSQWQDSQYSFALIRSSLGRTYRLVGVLKRLQAAEQAAVLEASRLDEKEAPQRELDRLAKADEAEREKLEKARMVNKPKFRP